jgi:hypothetical protein
MAHTYHKLFLFWPTHIIIYLKFFLDSMNIVKNRMRNQMRDDRLNDCLVIYIEKYIFIDFQNKKTIQNFHNMKNCRGQLLIVHDQKVTAGALDAVVATVVECVGMLVGADGGCVPAGTPTLKSVKIQRVRV